MILRRVIGHFKHQEWTAIGIDFVIVVLGVFVGIQVSNWNQQRAEDVRAQAYLVRVNGNLATDLQSIERRVVFWSEVIDYGKDAVHYAETGELVDGSAWKTVLAFYQASQLWQWVPSDATYQEMRSGGELGLLSELRFWVANQGVALTVIGNYKTSLRAMLARQPAGAAP
jgi:hypothetical protein